MGVVKSDQLLEYVLQMSCMHWEREKQEIEDDTVLGPGQLKKWSCHFTEMRNKEFVGKEQERSWRHIDFKMPFREPCEEVQCTVRYMSQNVIGDLQTEDTNLAAIFLEMR